MWSFQPRRRRPAWSSAPRCATALFHPPIPTHWDVGLRAASRLAVIKGDLNPLKMSISLVGALEPWMDYDFPFSWEWNVIIPIDFHSIIFQRGRLNHQVDYHHIIILSHNSPYYHWFITQVCPCFHIFCCFFVKFISFQVRSWRHIHCDILGASRRFSWSRIRAMGLRSPW